MSAVITALAGISRDRGNVSTGADDEGSLSC